jgi:hypothetical protein
LLLLRLPLLLLLLTVCKASAMSHPVAQVLPPSLQ